MTRYRTGLPATKRLAVELEKRIFSGDLKPGAPLPSMRHFAEERGVDLSSVLGAYRLLEKKGLIVREHGRGCYVGSNIRREIVPNRRLYGFHENMGELLRGAPDEFVCFDFGSYQNYPQYFDFLKERIERKPGLILMDENMLPAMVEEGLLMPLDSLLKDSALEPTVAEVAPVCRQVFRYRCSTFALPVFCLPVMAYFNRRLFEEAGVALPGEDWNWESLFHLLDQFTLFSNLGRFEHGALGLLLDPNGCLPIISQFGGEVFDRNGNCAFDSDVFYRGLIFFERVIRHLGCCVHKWGDKREYLGELLANGRIAFIIGSEQDASFAREILTEQEFYELPLPGYAAGQMTSFSALGIAISAGRYDPKELFRFLTEESLFPCTAEPQSSGFRRGSDGGLPEGTRPEPPGGAVRFPEQRRSLPASLSPSFLQDSRVPRRAREARKRIFRADDADVISPAPCNGKSPSRSKQLPLLFNIYWCCCGNRDHHQRLAFQLSYRATRKIRPGGKAAVKAT